MTTPDTFSRAYLVCATPRSGSTLLCELLRSTERAGRPLEHFEVLRHSGLPRQPREYFLTVDDERVLDRLAPLEPAQPSTETPEAWWTRIVQTGRSDNGVWGGKLMWGHAGDFIERVRQLPGLADADLDTALRRLLDDPTTVYVTRRDKVAQAVSLWRAVQTQRWRSSPDRESVQPVYDFAGIDHLVRQLGEQDAEWLNWFERTGRRPLRLEYESDIEPDPVGAAARVLRELGLPDDEIPAPGLARQRDEVSETWADRYRSETRQVA